MRFEIQLLQRLKNTAFGDYDIEGIAPEIEVKLRCIQMGSPVRELVQFCLTALLGWKFSVRTWTCPEMTLVAMPFVTSSFLLLIVRPGTPSALAPSTMPFASSSYLLMLPAFRNSRRLIESTLFRPEAVPEPVGFNTELTRVGKLGKNYCAFSRLKFRLELL